jgi:hypothetical protein
MKVRQLQSLIFYIVIVAGVASRVAMSWTVGVVFHPA